VDTPVIVIEAYLPDAGQRAAAWYDRLVERASAGLQALELDAVLLVLTSDETALWLLLPRDGAASRDDDLAAIEASARLAAATAYAGGRIVERTMTGRLVDRREPRPGGPGSIR
jgi:hypothetical protein